MIELGADPSRLGRWERGVDVERFDPAKADRDVFPGEIKVLYSGRLTRERGSTCSPRASFAPTPPTRGCTC